MMTQSKDEAREEFLAMLKPLSFFDCQRHEDLLRT